MKATTESGQFHTYLYSNVESKTIPTSLCLWEINRFICDVSCSFCERKPWANSGGMHLQFEGSEVPVLYGKINRFVLLSHLYIFKRCPEEGMVGRQPPLSSKKINSFILIECTFLHTLWHLIIKYCQTHIISVMSQFSEWGMLSLERSRNIFKVV